MKIQDLSYTGGHRNVSVGWPGRVVCLESLLTIGETHTLSLMGSAVHGGGSCQVSLSTDTQPTRNSSWMVIKSIEGGCPANVPGNLPSDPQAMVATNFTYTIPESVGPGRYTIAWTWLNKQGNREFYMNCGLAEVQAPRFQHRSRRVSRGPSPPPPPLFVANIPSINSCVAPSGYDYHFPNPGADVDVMGAGPYIDLSCDDGAPEGPGLQRGNESALATPGTADSSPSRVGLDKAPGTGNLSPTTATEGTNVGGTQPMSNAPCVGEGLWACADDGRSFHRCASGVWSASMAMSEGTSCSPGTSNFLNLTATKGKRYHRRSPFHH